MEFILIPTTYEVLITLILFMILSFSYKKINKALIFTPVTPVFLVLSITCSTIIALNRLDFISDKIFGILLMEYFIYYFFIVISPLFISKKTTNLALYVNEREFDKFLLKIMFYLSTTLGIFYIVLLWGMYDYGSDRFILNRTFRPLMLLNQLFSFWVIGLSSILFAKTKQRQYFIYIFVTLILSGFMGSRAQLVIGFLWFVFFYFQYTSISFKTLIKIIFVATILSILPTYLMYENALSMLINRIILSADIYIWSFIIGDYAQLIGYYDPVSYLLHPYSSLVGIKGYEFPFGAQIKSTVGIEPDGTGPQDHMLMLGLLFYEDNYSRYLFTFGFALLTMFSLLFTFYFFKQTKIHLSIRVLLIMLFYSRCISIFVGVNAYSFNVVILMIGVCFYLIILFFKKLTVKDVNEHVKNK